jgi:hypothetical protein
MRAHEFMNTTDIVAYHGTRGRFETFEGGPFYFTSSPEIATEYAEHATGNGDPHVRKVTLHLRDPLIFDAGGKYWPVAIPAAVRIARRDGRDSVIVQNVRDGLISDILATTYIAFGADQIS